MERPKEIDELRNYLSSLEGFNEKILNSSSILSNYVYFFYSFIPKLDNLTETIFDAFHVEKPEETQKNNESSVNEYIEKSNIIANFLNSVVEHIVNDKFTAAQVMQARELFIWFSDISKAYNEFHPTPSYMIHKPSRRLHKKLDKQFSKVVLELAKNLNQEPTDLQSLNILPSTFPHHVIAFSHLLCKIIDVQQHLVFSEFSIRAENENNEILLRHPSPRMLSSNEEFQLYLQLQNELLSQIRNERRIIESLFVKLNKIKKEFFEAREWLVSTIQNKFIDIREASISFLEELVQDGYKFRYYKNIQFYHENHIIPEFDKNITNEIIQEDNKICDLLQKDYPRELIAAEILSYQKIKEKLNNIIISSRQHIEFQRKYLQEITIHPSLSKMHDTRKNYLYQFREIIDKIRRRGSDSLSAVREFGKVEDAMNNIPDINEKFSSKSFILMNSTLIPSVENLENILNEFKNNIKVKTEEVSNILEQIAKTRVKADRINDVNETIKYKMNNPAELCPRCERERSYVILTCGHTFCEECYQSIMETLPLRCPYHSCQKEFTNDDICPISWEF